MNGSTIKMKWSSNCVFCDHEDRPIDNDTTTTTRLIINNPPFLCFKY